MVRNELEGQEVQLELTEQEVKEVFQDLEKELEKMGRWYGVTYSTQNNDISDDKNYVFEGKVTVAIKEKICESAEIFLETRLATAPEDLRRSIQVEDFKKWKKGKDGKKGILVMTLY